MRGSFSDGRIEWSEVEVEKEEELKEEEEVEKVVGVAVNDEGGRC